ncbi:MAG: hypothetical protein LUI87_04895 [Lachnospiraceae bacterium]|nr:hypothetical protein [Lachnospiraceae bacterium]
MNKLYKFSTLYLSYTPLWISILFVDSVSLFWDKTATPWTERISIVVIILAYIVSIPNLIASLRGLNKEGAEPSLTIKHCKEDKTVAMEYLLSFILPMFAFDFTLWTQVVLFLIYYLVLGILCLRHNLLVANIILEFSGYRFYHIVAEDSYRIEVERDVISRERLTNKLEEEIFLRAINDDVYYDVTKKGNPKRRKRKRKNKNDGCV